MAHSSRDRIVAYVFVAIQAVLIAGIVLVPERHDWPLPPVAHTLAWLLIVLAGTLGLWAAKWLGAGLTALPLPNGRVELVTHGPYRWVRHPMYSAVMLAMAGVAWITRSVVGAVLAAGLIVLFAVKSRWEERHLVAGFPGYNQYRARTGRFFPGVG